MSDNDNLVEYTRLTRVSEKPPSCEACPLYNELQICSEQQPQPVDILILAPSPTPIVNYQLKRINEYGNTSLIDMPYSTDAEKAVQSAVTKALRDSESELKVGYWYAAQCRTWKVPKDAIVCCSSKLAIHLMFAKPKVIIPLGTEAMKSLGMTSNVKDSRAKVHEVKVFGKDYKVVPSFHPIILIKQPGVLSEFDLDIKKAIESIAPPVPQRSIEELIKNYRLPKTISAVRSVVKEILAYEKNGKPTPIAVDIETNSLKSYAPNAKTITISFAWDEGLATTIILDHKAATEEYRKHLPEVKALVQKVLESPRIKIGHNFKFDYKFLVFKDGYNIVDFKYDTLLMEHLLNEERSTYKLKSLVRDYFPEYANYEEATDAIRARMSKEKKWFPKLSKTATPKELSRSFTAATLKRNGVPTPDQEGKECIRNLALALYSAYYEYARLMLLGIQEFLIESPTFEDLPIDELCKYAAIDADVTWKLAKRQIKLCQEDNSDTAGRVEVLKKTLQEDGDCEEIKEELSKTKLLRDLLTDTIIPMSNITSEMEHYGFKLDVELADSWIDEADRALIELENDVSRISSSNTKNISLKSTADLARLFYSILGLPVLKTTDKGAPSTDEESLTLLYEKTKHPAVKSVLDYRGAKSCKEKLSTYKVAAEIDGYVHTDFNLFGTSTGRLSSSGGINLQNIPSKKFPFGKNLKRVFIPSDRDKFNIGNVDLAGAEVIILTAYARDENLINAINAGLDTHCYTAAKIKGIDYQTFYDRWQEEKTSNSGKEYKTMRSNAKAVTFGIIYGATAYTIANELEISEAEAEELLNEFFKLYPGIKVYMETTAAQARLKKYVDTYFGRKRRFPILAHNPRDWHVRNQAINFRIQSTAAELLNCQIIDMKPYLEKELDGRIIAQVHDAIVFEYNKEKTSLLTEFFETHLTQSIKRKYPWLPVPMKFEIEAGPSYGDVKSLQ